MVRYKAIIAYDGTNFNGFQKQPNGRTVQEEVEKTLNEIYMKGGEQDEDKKRSSNKKLPTTN